MEYIKQFQTHNQYEAYVESENFIRPNVSYCVDKDELHFNNKKTTEEETRVVAYFYIDNPGTYAIMGYDPQSVSFVPGGSLPEPEAFFTDYFDDIEIDGVLMDEITGTYQFDTTGYHVIKYTLNDPTEISDYAFGECSKMTYVKMPTGITSIGEFAFGNTNLHNITIPETVTEIGNGAFYKPNIDDFGETPTIFGGKANLIIPDSVTRIGQSAFYNYAYDTLFVFIGKNVNNIGSQAFSNTQYAQWESSDTKIFYFFGTTPPLVSNNFTYNPYAILVPPESINDYKQTTGFTNYTYIIYDYNKELELSNNQTTTENNEDFGPIPDIPNR